jgi:hypothetical protein
VGEFSPVVETMYGYHILRLDDRKVVPFAEARSRVARETANEIGSPSDALRAWVSQATGGASLGDARGREAALAEAARRGVTVPKPNMDEIERAWDDDVVRWAEILGFDQGATPEQVGDAALAALGLTAQSAALARNELAQNHALLAARYPVVVAEESQGSAAGSGS